MAKRIIAYLLLSGVMLGLVGAGLTLSSTKVAAG
jgi:hypothetical protein